MKSIAFPLFLAVIVSAVFYSSFNIHKKRADCLTRTCTVVGLVPHYFTDEDRCFCIEPAMPR